jgi:hypothetical protein
VFLGPAPTSRGLRISAPLVGLEGLVLTGYGLLILVQALRFGLSGPEEVSNVPAVALEVGIFAGFGIALLFTARALWQARRVARAPAVLAQIIAVVVGGPLLTASENSSRIAGVLIVAVAVASVIALFSRGVTDEIT